MEDPSLIGYRRPFAFSLKMALTVPKSAQEYPARDAPARSFSGSQAQLVHFVSGKKYE
jgi:hypothetical protein